MFRRFDRYFFILGMLIIACWVFAPGESYAQDIPVKTEQKKQRKRRIKSKKGKKADRAKSNKKQLRANRRGRKADRAAKGDITGRKFRPDRTRRKTYARPAVNPYAGRKLDPRKAERAGATPPPTFREPPKGEKPRKGDITGKRRVRTASGSSARRKTYSQPAVQSRSRSSERQIRSRRGDVGTRSASRASERRQAAVSTVPRSASGGTKIRRKRNPYAGREQRRGERATDKDIAGRKLRTRGKMSAKPAPKRGYTKPDTYYGRKSRGEGGRFGRGAMAAGGYSTRSRGAESAARTRREEPSTKNFQTPRKAAGEFKRNPNVSSGPRPEGSRFKDRKTAVRSNSRPGERKVQAAVTVPRSISGNARIKKSKNPYAGREQRLGERFSDRDIAGRKLRTRNYQSPSPKWSRKLSRPDPYYQRDERSTKVKTNPVPTYVPGRNQIRASKYQGRDKRKPTLAGGGGSISGRTWNNKGRPVQSPGYVNPKISRYQGNQKREPRLTGGGGSISGRSWNNKGRPVESPGYVNPRISRYQGNVKVRRELKGGGSISREGWNNKGKPLARANPGDARMTRWQGNFKTRKPLKGGGSISTSGWNNKGKPLAQADLGNPRMSGWQGNYKTRKPLKGGGSISTSGWNNKGKPLAQADLGNPRMSGWQGNYKTRKPLKGGGSISTSGWNNKGEPIAKANLYNPKISKYQGNQLANPGYFNAAIGRYKGETKVTRRKMQKDGKLPQSLPGEGTARATTYQGNMLPNPGYYNAAIGRYRGDLKVNRHKRQKEGEPIPQRIQKAPGTELGGARGLAFYRPGSTKRAGWGPIDKPRQIKGSAYGQAKGLLWYRPGDVKRYNLTDNSRPKQLEGATYGRAKGVLFYKPSKAKKYGGFVAMQRPAKKTDGTKFGRVTTFSFYTPRNVKDYGGWKPTETNVSRKKMHPSSAYARGDIKSSSNAKDKTFKFGIWWASLFKRNENQPVNLKSKEKKPRYDKRESELWYE